MEALDALLHGILKHEDALIAALHADFGSRSARETRMLEILPVVDEIRYIKRKLKRWMRPRSASVNWQFLPSRARIIYQPLGVVGVIGAWNYPILLTLSPVVNALAAGNHVMIKPSELAPTTADTIRSLVAEYFPVEYVSVITGGAETSAAFSALPFDHLIFTGSGRVGKLVMKAAAENLTPVTLELGGKSPALVHDSYSMEIAAERICSAKFWNAGQTCVAPDYVLVPAHKQDEFVREAEMLVARRFPRLASGHDYTSMISQAAWHRMQHMVDDARSKGAQVLQINPGNEVFTAESCVFAPTLLVGVNDSMRVMQEEIFGPVLPIVGYSSLDSALQQINAGPRPLALYYFDSSKARINEVLERTVSGGVTVNDCVFHLPQHSLPFGGVGASGMGAYHGFDGFETFSKKKGVLLQNGLVGALLAFLLKPPYSPRTDRLLDLLISRNKPHSVKKITLVKKNDS
jgi:coniferyl-aldehyde dehydrogenase